MGRALRLLLLALVAGLAAAGVWVIAQPPEAAGIGVVDSMQLVRPTDSMDEEGVLQLSSGLAKTVEPADTIDLIAARNEYESVQIVVAGGERALSSVDVRAGAGLEGPGDATISAAAITISRAAPIDLDKASDLDLDGDTGPFFDALIPRVDAIVGERRDGFPAELAAGELLVAWIDIHVPAGAQPGTYTGEVIVDADGETTPIATSVEVLDIDLPSTPTLRGAFDINPNQICAAHSCRDSDDAWGVHARYGQLLLDHRIGIAKPAHGTPEPDNDRLFEQHALPLIDGTALTQLAGAAVTDVTIYQWCSQCAGNYRRLGGLFGFVDRYAYHCDEMGRDTAAWQSCADSYAAASASWDGDGADGTPLPLQMTAPATDLAWAADPNGGGQPDLAQAVSRLIPILTDAGGVGRSFPGPDSLAETWQYISCSSHGCGDSARQYAKQTAGWPSYVIDQHPSQQRAMPWIIAADGAEGEYHYETVRMLDTAWTDQYIEGGNGDGTLLYPGMPSSGQEGVPDIGGRTEIPLATIRLKRMRDGREDWELLHQLRQDCDVDVTAIVREIFPTDQEAIVTGEAMLAAREQMMRDLAAGCADNPA